MIFKNAMFYKLADFELTAEELEEALLKNVSENCGKYQLQTLGWAAPLGKHGKMLTHTIENHTMICMRTHKKVVDIAAVNELVEEEVTKIEVNENRQVFKKERAAVKESVLSKILPTALTKSSLTYGFIDFDQQIICIDTTNSRSADIFLSLLRDSIGTLPCYPVQVKASIDYEMKMWLANKNPPEGITIGCAAQIASYDDAGEVVTFKNSSDLVEALESHIQTCQVVMAQFIWEDDLAFMLKSDFSFKSLKFSSAVFEDAGACDDDEDLPTRFDSDMAITCGILSEVYEDFLAIFGGPPD